MYFIKKTSLLLWLAHALLWTAVPAEASSYVQNAYSRAGMSLNGHWDRIIDPYENGYYNHRYEPHTNGYFKNQKAMEPSDLVEYNFATSDKLRVPGDWNTQETQLKLYEGTVWYHKEFNLKKQNDKNYVLHFGAVNYSAIVYVNGTKIGEHEGGFTSFQFNVSAALKQGKNSVVVKVDNRRERDQIPTVNTDWWNYGGITREVTLMELPASYIADYQIGLADNKDNALLVKVKLEGDKTKFGDTVKVSIPELSVDKKIAINSRGEGQLEIPATPQLWSPEQPKRYAVALEHQGDKVSELIGFRTISTKGADILLNGKALFLRGISIHEESPSGAGRAWSEDDARTLLTWAKQLGCNFVRLAHYPHNEHMTRMADEMGLLVWSEIPVYWTVQFTEAKVYAKAQKQLDEMITRDINRASIILWSVANETPVTKPRLTFLAKLVDRAKTLDPSRLITAALDTQTKVEGGKMVDDPLGKIVDVIGVNNYCGWYYDAPGSCAGQKWMSAYNKPMILSEFGADALQGLHGDKGQRWTEEYQADVYVNNLAMIDNMQNVRGVTPWILKDFMSPRRPLPDIQDFYNRKGLVSEQGIRKQAWYVLRDYYAKKAAQSVTPIVGATR